MAWIQMMRNRFPFRNILMMTNLLVLFSDGSTAPFPPFFQPLCLSGVLSFLSPNRTPHPPGGGCRNESTLVVPCCAGKGNFLVVQRNVCVCLGGRGSMGFNGVVCARRLYVPLPDLPTRLCCEEMTARGGSLWWGR